MKLTIAEILLLKLFTGLIFSKAEGIMFMCFKVFQLCYIITVIIMDVT